MEEKEGILAEIIYQNEVNSYTVAEFETEEGKEILRDLGIEGDYEGIGHCILGYVDGEEPAPLPRKENNVNSIYKCKRKRI